MSQITRQNPNMPFLPKCPGSPGQKILRGADEDQLWQPHFSKTTKHTTHTERTSKARSV